MFASERQKEKNTFASTPLRLTHCTVGSQSLSLSLSSSLFILSTTNCFNCMMHANENAGSSRKDTELKRMRERERERERERGREGD